MISIMDEAVGDLIQMLKQNRLWDQSLVIVTADNGGETRDGGNNYPLRKGSRIYQLIRGRTVTWIILNQESKVEFVRWWY